MKTAIFIVLLLAHMSNAHAATKALKQSGVDKLNAWAQNVARIYGTALKNSYGTTKAETLDIYVYAYAPGGFTTAGFVKASYSNSNISAQATCLTSGTPQPVPLTASCPGSMATNGSGKDYGAFDPAGARGLILDPLAGQMCMTQNYGFGSCNGANLVSSVRSSCVKDLRKYQYDVGAVPGCTNGGTGWTALYYNVREESLCLAASSRQTSFAPISSIPCAAGSRMAEIRQVLQSYKSYILSCNSGLVPQANNGDLTELNAVLNEIETGFPLTADDVQAGTNPPAARNPWTFINPTLATEGDTFPEQMPAKEVQFKARVSGASDPIRFSVSAAPVTNWSFIPGTAGQTVTREIVNGLAETGFKLGSVTGNYQIKATCTECCPGEVAYTAKALTVAQATRLDPYNCNTSAFINGALSYGVRVRATNRINEAAVSGRNVAFTLVSHPGGTGMSLTTPTVPPTNPPAAVTNSQGIAKANLTLGTLPGNYRISAVCQGCEANQEVTCNVNALANPELFTVSPEVMPLVLKKSPIKVTLQHYIVEPGRPAASGAPAVPGGITQVYVEGPPDMQLVSSVQAVPNTGGHQHFNGVRPTGTVSPATHDTNGDGNAIFSYTAGGIGGQERIIISAPDMPDYGDAVVLVSVPGLVRLGPSTDYYLYGETPTHPSNHYGGEILRQEIRDIAHAYIMAHRAIIRVNDISLINGGLFDHLNTWTTPHALHRTGTSVDFNRSHFSIIRRQWERTRTIAADIAALADAPVNNINCTRINEDNQQTAEDLRLYGSLAHFECPR